MHSIGRFGLPWPAVKLLLEITALDLHLFRSPRQTLEQGTRISTRLPDSQAISSVKPLRIATFFLLFPFSSNTTNRRLIISSTTTVFALCFR